MEIKKISGHFREHFFFYTLAPIVIVVGVFSFYRFMVNHDYLVSYEGSCGPSAEKCFLGCEDDACTTEYYYTKIVKYEPDVYKECGPDITDCEAANTCLPEDKECSITYCNPETSDTCATTQGNEQTKPTEAEPLQTNDINNSNI